MWTNLNEKRKINAMIKEMSEAIDKNASRPRITFTRVDAFVFSVVFTLK